MALGASSLVFQRISPSYLNNILLRPLHLNLYITFEGMNGEVNSKDKFCSSILLDFQGIIVTLQRLCLQLRCIIYRVTLGTSLLLNLRDNDKNLMGMLLPCCHFIRMPWKHSLFEESTQHYKSWLDDYMQVIKKRISCQNANFC